jgi:methylmalonyl-CoA/ethylmalonyl-CoA epimerase
MSENAPLQTATLCQIGFVARDADRVARNFSALLGIPAGEPILTDDYETARTEYRGKPTRAKAKLIFFDLGQISIEIIEPLGGPSTWKEFLDRHGDGVHHIAFTVKNTGETADALGARGLPSVQKGVFEGGSYNYIEAEKSIGVILELLDRTAG